MKPETRIRRFFDNITFSDGCCEWLGRTNDDGYGTFRIGPATAVKQQLVHRFAWEIFNGPIPESMCVLHNCDNRVCVKPTHLFLGTRDVNNKDRMEKGRSATGERNGQCRLSDQALRNILASTERGVALARKYEVTQDTICRIRNGRYPREVTNG